MIGAGGYELVATSFSSAKANDIGMNCLNETITLPVWPHTSTNASMAERLIFCHAEERTYTYWLVSSLVAISIIPIVASGVGLCCIQNAKDREALKRSRHGSSIVDQQGDN